MYQRISTNHPHDRLFFFWNFNVYFFPTAGVLNKECTVLQKYYFLWFPGWWGNKKRLYQNHSINSILFFTSWAQPEAVVKGLPKLHTLSKSWLRLGMHSIYYNSFCFNCLLSYKLIDVAEFLINDAEANADLLNCLEDFYLIDSDYSESSEILDFFQDSIDQVELNNCSALPSDSEDVCFSLDDFQENLIL